MSRRSSSRTFLGSLPLFGMGAGALYLLYQTFRVRGGKEWRGYAGTVSLTPSLVYRFDFVAPGEATSATQASIEAQLSSRGARNFLWNILPGETHLYFDQSFQEPATVTFGKSAVPPFTLLTVRRLDGLDWDAP